MSTVQYFNNLVGFSYEGATGIVYMLNHTTSRDESIGAKNPSKITNLYNFNNKVYEWTPAYTVFFSDSTKAAARALHSVARTLADVATSPTTATITTSTTVPDLSGRNTSGNGSSDGTETQAENLFSFLFFIVSTVLLLVLIVTVVLVYCCSVRPKMMKEEEALKAKVDELANEAHTNPKSPSSPLRTQRNSNSNGGMSSNNTSSRSMNAKADQKNAEVNKSTRSVGAGGNKASAPSAGGSRAASVASTSAQAPPTRAQSVLPVSSRPSNAAGVPPHGFPANSSTNYSNPTMSNMNGGGTSGYPARPAPSFAAPPAYVYPTPAQGPPPGMGYAPNTGYPPQMPMQAWMPTPPSQQQQQQQQQLGYPQDVSNNASTSSPPLRRRSSKVSFKSNIVEPQ